MRIFGREPTLWLHALSAVLSLVVTFGLAWLTAEQAALWVAALTAVLAVINAALVRPVAPVAFTGLVAAVAALAAAYGFNATQEQVGMVQAVVVAVLALLARSQVTPMPDLLRGNEPVAASTSVDIELEVPQHVGLGAVVGASSSEKPKSGLVASEGNPRWS